jgi:hypothetical protein
LRTGILGSPLIGQTQPVLTLRTHLYLVISVAAPALGLPPPLGSGQNRPTTFHSGITKYATRLYGKFLLVAAGDGQNEEHVRRGDQLRSRDARQGHAE